MSKSQLVFSTDQGKLCPHCQQAIKQCTCKSNTEYAADDCVRISRETKGRKGKGVTLIKGIGGSEKELKALAKELKQKCSTGGALKDGVIEIQGDQREKIKVLLEKKSYLVKFAGG